MLRFKHNAGLAAVGIESGNFDFASVAESDYSAEYI